jgi:hypothetical protein
MAPVLAIDAVPGRPAGGAGQHHHRAEDDRGDLDEDERPARKAGAGGWRGGRREQVGEHGADAAARTRRQIRPGPGLAGRAEPWHGHGWNLPPVGPDLGSFQTPFAACRAGTGTDDVSGPIAIPPEAAPPMRWIGLLALPVAVLIGVTVPEPKLATWAVFLFGLITTWAPSKELIGPMLIGVPGVSVAVLIGVTVPRWELPLTT